MPKFYSCWKKTVDTWKHLFVFFTQLPAWHEYLIISCNTNPYSSHFKAQTFCPSFSHTNCCGVLNSKNYFKVSACNFEAMSRQANERCIVMYQVTRSDFKEGFSPLALFQRKYRGGLWNCICWSCLELLCTVYEGKSDFEGYIVTYLQK